MPCRKPHLPFASLGSAAPVRPPRSPAGERAAWLDRSAVGLSGLCVFHCLAGALLLAVASSAGGLWSHQVHAVGLGLALPLAVLGLWRGLRRHGRAAMLAPALGGIALMAWGAVGAHGAASEMPVTVAGVVLLAVAHLMNLHWRQAPPRDRDRTDDDCARPPRRC